MSKVVEVLFFGALSERFGVRSTALSIEQGQTIRQATDQLIANYSVSPSELPPLYYAVNESFADPQKILHDKDTLALMTPVSGG